MLFTQGKTEITLAEAGYSGSRLDALHRHFQNCIDENIIQCATYCLSRKGKIFAHGAIGKRIYNSGEPVQPDSVRYISSITKVFTAVAIMRLVEDGITRLDVPVGQILPQFDTPPYNSINLFHLLSHTSGMYADAGCFENKYQTSYYQMIEHAYKLHNPEKDGEFDWLAAALGTIGPGLRTKPGEEWSYCSFGFAVLGAVIEKLTGVHAHKYIEDNICKPLGMKDTVFESTPEMNKRYIIDNKELEEEINNAINEEKEAPHPVLGKQPRTDGGLESTAYDLTRFGSMILNGGTFDGVRILGRKTVENMTALQTANPNYCWGSGGSVINYGVGFQVFDGVHLLCSKHTALHEGSGYCSMYVDKEEELAASWFVPVVGGEWHPKPLISAVNVIWSGLL